MLFAIGALFLKRSTTAGVNVWSQIFVTNIFASTIFSFCVLLDGTFYGIQYLWQPALVGLMYVLGQILILSAVHVGDVSVATPITSTKVLVVAGLSAVFTSAKPSATIWIAAALATVGVALINFVVPKSDRAVVLRRLSWRFWERLLSPFLMFVFLRSRQIGGQGTSCPWLFGLLDSTRCFSIH